MSSSNSGPPPPNPVLNAYEQFVRDTPLVTRYVLTTLSVSWALSFFIDLSYPLATIPFFCIFRFEIYRIVTSPLLCLNVLSLIFAYISFLDNGKRLEFSMGSAAFAFYLLTIGVCTNAIFVVAFFLLYGITGNSGFLWWRSVGVWTLLFAVIATDCSRSPRESQRRLFFVTVPTLYFPLALWALFALLGGGDISSLISVAVGYGYGHGYLDMLKLNQSRFNQWEETVLVNFIHRPGWVVGHAATGDNAWNENPIYGLSFFSTPSEQSQSEGLSRASRPTRATLDSASEFPSGGRTFAGGPTRRPNASEARAVMLAAAEKRASAREDGDDSSSPV